MADGGNGQRGTNAQPVTDDDLQAAQGSAVSALINRGAAVVFRWRVEPGVWPVEYVSENVRRFGYTPEDLTSGRVSWPGVTHPDDVPRLAAEVAELMACGAPHFHQQYRILTATGETRWIDDHTTAVLDDAGRLTHYEGLLIDITGERQADATLREQDASLRFLIENTLDVLYTFDTRTGTFAYISPVVARWGLTPEEVIGKPLTEFIHPDDLAPVLADLQRTMTTGDAFLSRFRVVTPNGQVVPVEEYGKPMLRDGEVVQITGVLRDISERLRAEEAVALRDRRFRALVEHSADAIMLLDPEGHILYASPAAALINGRSPESHHGQHAFEIIHPDDLPQAMQAFLDLRDRPGEIACAQYRLQHADGGWRWIDAVAYNLCHEPAVQGIVVNYRDITDRKRAEEALRASERKFAALFASVPVPVALTSLEDSRYLDVNRAFEHVTGYARDEVIGHTPAECQLFADTAQRRQALALIRQHGLLQDFEALVRSKTGDVRTALFSGQALEVDGERLLLTAAVDITDRKRAEEALRQAYAGVEAQVQARTAELAEANASLRASEEKFRTVIETVPAGIFIAQDDRFIFVNAAAAAMTGYPREELITKPFIELVHPAYHAMMIGYAQDRLAGRPAPSRYEMQFLTRDGECRWGDFSPCVMTFEGRPAIMASVIDITARKQAEEALRESEARYHALFRDNTAPMLVIDPDTGRIVDANRAAAAYYGYPLETLLRMRIQQINTLPDDEVQAEMARACDLECRQFSFRHRLASGEIRDVEVYSGPVQVDGATCLYSTIIDVAARKQAEEQVQRLLRDTEQRAAELDATIHAIADGVLIYMPDLNTSRCNAAACTLFGYLREQLEVPLAEWLALVRLQTAEGDPVPLEECSAYRAAVHGLTIRGIVRRFTRADGEQRVVAVSAAPIRGADGALLGAVATYADITPLHALRQRQEELLHMVSHDLRIPLTVIHGHMEILEMGLRRRQLDGAFAQNTDAIARNMQRLNTMIQDLVDMARLEGQQCPLTRTDLLLQREVPELLARLRMILPMHRVAVEIPDDLPPVSADQYRLERILLNLLTNAFKYSAEETPVRLQARREGEEVVIAVSDQGCGIAPRDLPHIFERFYRAGGERKAEGIGLGLYITKLLVEAHAAPAEAGTAMVGGRITVDSTVGQGSTFTFTLPSATVAVPR